jgi:MFS family permease
VANLQRRRWAVVAALFLVTFSASNPLSAYGVFLPILAEEFGWSRGALSLALTLNLIVGGGVGFWIGAVGDRRGPRLPLVVTVVLAGAGFALVARVEALWHLYVFVGVMAGVGMSGFYVLSTSTVARWFQAQRGLAVAIVLNGYSLGVMTGGPLAAWLIGRLGWRAAYVALGAGLTVVGGLASLVVTPPPRPARSPAPTDTTPAASGLGVREALRDPRLWLLGVSWLLEGTVLMTLSVHGVPFLHDRGHSLEAASLALTAYGFGAVVGRIICGPAAERFGVLPMMAACAGLQIAAVVPLLHVTSMGPILLLFALFGAGVIGGDSVYVKAVPDVFGLRALGGIIGVLAVGWRAGAALGPAAAGLVYDLTGTYVVAFGLAPLAIGASAALFVVAVRPRA